MELPKGKDNDLRIKAATILPGAPRPMNRFVKIFSRFYSFAGTPRGST
jgi:hypothetical protein